MTRVPSPSPAFSRYFIAAAAALAGFFIGSAALLLVSSRARTEREERLRGYP